MLQRDGSIITIVTPLANGEAIKPFIYANLKPGSTVITDGFGAYKGLEREGNIHTNAIEGLWFQLKRDIIGVCHQVSPKHLHRYCHEFGCKYNTRMVSDVIRFDSCIKNVNGKRLTYANLIK